MWVDGRGLPWRVAGFPLGGRKLYLSKKLTSLTFLSVGYSSSSHPGKPKVAGLGVLPRRASLRFLLVCL